jgi:hypothetical protein
MRDRSFNLIGCAPFVQGSSPLCQLEWWKVADPSNPDPTDQFSHRQHRLKLEAIPTASTTACLRARFAALLAKLAERGDLASR